MKRESGDLPEDLKRASRMGLNHGFTTASNFREGEFDFFCV